MTKVLIAVASRHGATDEIAEEIADQLRQEVPGAAVVVRAAAEPGELTGFDAVLVGSAIYLGRWLPPARRLVEHHRVELAAVPVWLFSSGPVGDAPVPVDDLAEVTALGATVGARGHRVFAGRLDRSELRWAERLAVGAVHAAEGDFRDHGAIRAWAAEVAADLATLIPGRIG